LTTRAGRLPRRPAAGADDGMVVAIRHGTDWPAVFCVHPSTGGVGEFVGIARNLDDGRQCHGLQSPGLVDGGRPIPTVADMAGRYLAAVGRVQPAGPYLFAGWSMGGYVAVEMARQAVDCGADVAGVFLVAPPHDERGGRWRRRAEWASARTALAGLDANIDASTEPSRLALWDLADDPDDAELPHLGESDVQRLRIERTNLVNVWAGIRYRAGLRRTLRPYDLRVVLFVPRDDPAPQARAAVAQWRGALRREPEVVSVPGSHATVVHGPGAAVIGARLNVEVGRAGRPHEARSRRTDSGEGGVYR
jgi:thioesterase domain-containing protein